MMIINFPEPGFRIKKEEGREYIFDALRKKWVALTPEEWVRQNFVQYLLQVKNYPASLIALEKEIKLGELKKRFDILIYNKNHQPWMMIECKAVEVNLDEKVLEQVLRYNVSVPVTFIVITNGEKTYAWQRLTSGLEMLEDIPDKI
ncbi:MAG: type I restriction enzyme HsdR N-terminal domain-containing protein [Chitinophagaceae bacterium]|nr:type I restriction enzyme HsdR N-terminal domain-containing protein [Chitinophagaceae bacterium]MBL0272122.1 type I restriction enzyme HsdR N-terminal domain-containing protein [Chitinophagaceae bacterium]